MPSCSGVAGALKPKPAEDPAHHYKYPICEFLASGLKNPGDELVWGPYKLCDLDTAGEWFRRAKGYCYSCITGKNICQDPPKIIYHQYRQGDKELHYSA
eukprot:jgi/Chrzof1/6358/Cz18g05170.t1